VASWLYTDIAYQCHQALTARGTFSGAPITGSSKSTRGGQVLLQAMVEPTVLLTFGNELRRA
jgi:hypothetical protein